MIPGNATVDTRIMGVVFFPPVAVPRELEYPVIAGYWSFTRDYASFTTPASRLGRSWRRSCPWIRSCSAKCSLRSLTMCSSVRKHYDLSAEYLRSVGLAVCMTPGFAPKLKARLREVFGGLMDSGG